MILKILRSIWFLSMLAVGANLLYVYAGLSEVVVIRELEDSSVSVNKEYLFYGWLVFVGVLNMMVYVLGKSIAPDETFRAWFVGLITTLNIFFIIAFSFIGLYNSSENFDFSRVGIVLYIGIGLVFLWLLSWPVIFIIRKISP